MHRVAALLACALASASICAAASAQHVRTLEPGAAVAELDFGARQWALPGGGWTLLGKQIRDVRINETKGGAETIEVFAGRVRDGALRAAIVVTAPTGGTRTASWREDPGCKHPKPLYREDGTSVTHPDCLVISAVTAVPATNPAAEVYDRASETMKAQSIRTLAPAIRVYAVVYRGDDYVRVSAWLHPGDWGIAPGGLRDLTTAPEPLARWGSALRAALTAAVGRNSGRFEIPPLP